MATELRGYNTKSLLPQTHKTSDSANSTSCFLKTVKRRSKLDTEGGVRTDAALQHIWVAGQNQKNLRQNLRNV